MAAVVFWDVDYPAVCIDPIKEQVGGDFLFVTVIKTVDRKSLRKVNGTNTGINDVFVSVYETYSERASHNDYLLQKMKEIIEGNEALPEEEGTRET